MYEKYLHVFRFTYMHMLRCSNFMCMRMRMCVHVGCVWKFAGAREVMVVMCLKKL